MRIRSTLLLGGLVLLAATPAAAENLDHFFTDLVPAQVQNVAILGSLEGVANPSTPVDLDAELFDLGGSLQFDPFSGLDQLGNAIFGQLQQFPVGSTVAGFTYEFDPNLAIFVRSTQGMGPILAERAQTNGKGKLNVSFAYSYMDFDVFEGDDVDDLPVTFEGDTPVLLPGDSSILIDQGGQNESLLIVQSGPGIPIGPDTGLAFTVEDGVFSSDQPIFAESNGLADGTYELFAAIPSISIDSQIHADVFALFATYGVTDWLDVGMVVPIIHIALDGKATTSGIFDPASVAGGGAPIETLIVNDDNEDATGIGDIILRGKARVFETDYADLAARLDFSLPTGKEEDLLGRGNGASFAQVIVSEQFGRFSPHLNLGLFFDWEDSDQSQFRYAAGVDVRVHERVTIAGDFIGTRDLDSDGIGDDQVAASGGLKVNVWRRLIVSGNALVRLNEEGLRADVIPSAAIEYTFF